MFKIINSSIKFYPERFVADFELCKFLDQSVPVLMGIFIFLNIFPHTTAIKEICYYLSVLIVIVLILLKKKEFTFQSPLLLPASLFVFWAFLSIFFSLNKANSIHDYYSHLLKYIILYHILTNFFNTKKRLIYLSWIIIISSCIFILVGLAYNYLVLGQNLSLRFGQTSFFAQASFNIIGVASVFAFILGSNQLYNQKNIYLKTFLVFSLMTLFLGLLLSQMRSSIIALFLSVFILLYKNKKRGFVFLSLMLIISTMFPIANRFHKKMLKNIVKESQIKINFLTIEVIKEYPIIGIGFGLQTYGKLDLEKFQKRLPQKFHQTGRIITDPHNMVLDITVRLGVVGLVLFFYIIFTIFKMLRDIIKQGKDELIQDWGRCLAAAFIGVSIIGLLQPIFSTMPEVVICLIFSMTTIIWRLNNYQVTPGFDSDRHT